MLLLNICVCIIVWLIGFNLKNAFKDFDKIDRSILNQLFFFHFAIAIGFHFYISIYGGDAIQYWSAPKSMAFGQILDLVEGGAATGVMYIINYIPSNIFDLSFFTGNMIYSLMGYLGFIYLYRILKPILVDRKTLSKLKLFGVPIFPWIWFLPNLHFWSSGVGKDSLLFFSIALFVYSLQKLRARWIALVLSMIISLSIRPHITLFLLLSFGIAYIFDGRLKAYQKMFIFLMFLIGFISIFDYVVEFLQLESLETSVIEEYTSTKASKLNQASSGSGVDISGYPFLFKVFTFLYRPLFFDINGILAVAASCENFILLCFSFLLFRNRPFRVFKKASFLLKGMVIYFIIGSIAFSLILGNLGIMLRQKNMFIPLMFIFGLWVLYEKKGQIKDRI